MRKGITFLIALFMIIGQVSADGSTYLNFTAVNGPATISLQISNKNMIRAGYPMPGLEFSIDSCTTWITYSIDSTISLSSGQKIFFKATMNNDLYYITDGIYFYFSMTGTICADGNVMSLIYPSMQGNLYKNAFKNLFYGCTSLTTAPALPASTLAECCYESMFSGCTSLEKAPDLPSRSLASNCYSNMFKDCSSLTDIPDLPSLNLADSCYMSMFSGCYSIEINEQAPGRVWKIASNAVSATNWNKDMFYGTGGTFQGSPEIGVDYYVASSIIDSFDVIVLANYDNRGTVTGGGKYDSLEVATLTATPNEGYKFTGWDNGLTNRVIKITVTSDTIITANFEPDNTAVDDVEGNYDITLAPNPVKTGEAILINGNFSDEELNGMMVEVIDLNGMVVRSNEANSSPVEIEGVDVAGAYIVRITAGTGKVYTQKLIVK